MTVQLYNTLTKSKQEFIPIEKGKVDLYVCGPTVYWYQHIGNMRGMLSWDVLRRVLEFSGFFVKEIMNITDVGHLTSDADTGEDKMEKGAKREGKSVWEIAEYYTGVFKEDLEKLHVVPPHIWCKATDHIKEQIEWIQKLEDRGYTYKTSDGVYYDTSKFSTYADFARLDVAGLAAGSRIDMRDKKNVTDFALWKYSGDKERQMEWESPWGKGFPGWHIECSAMATKYLGTHFDIHCGGKEHIRIHHTNEIAQAEAVIGKRWVNYWLHNEWLQMEGGKMAKSDGNVLTISVLQEKGYDPLAFRYMCLQTHYRKPMNFTFVALDGAAKALTRLWDFMHNLGVLETSAPNSVHVPKLIEEVSVRFRAAVEDDLNIPGALGYVFDFMTSINKLVLKRAISNDNVRDVLAKMKEFDTILGVLDHAKGEVDAELIHLIEKRERAREKKDFEEADRIRDELLSKGIILEDTPDGVRWKKR